MIEQFDIPIVLVIFRRPEKSVQIIDKIAKIKPKKLYLISDQGRNDKEKSEVSRCREVVEKAIDWTCEVVRDYADENRGVYDRIGLGALRVFENERWAIFLEDDNLPEISFFYYCEELLNKYETEPNILWICGTNYLESCSLKGGADYGFTRHMLPCGWASWGNKFSKCYDKDFSLYDKADWRKIRKSYVNWRLYRQDIRSWKMEMMLHRTTGRYLSWDYHMGFSLRINEMYGIFPRHNQIENIGVDTVSEHGGTSFDNVMTMRLCGMKSYPLCLPLIHPQVIEIDEHIEKLLAKIIIVPYSFRTLPQQVVGLVIKAFRFILRIPEGVRTREYIRLLINRKKNIAK